MLRLNLWIIPIVILSHHLLWILPPNIAQTTVPYQGRSCTEVNTMIMPIPLDFLSGCIDLHLYLYYARSNDHYCRSVLGLFVLVSESLLTKFEVFSSEQIIIESPVNNLWLNITAGLVLCLKFLLELPQ